MDIANRSNVHRKSWNIFCPIHGLGTVSTRRIICPNSELSEPQRINLHFLNWRRKDPFRSESGSRDSVKATPGHVVHCGTSLQTREKLFPLRFPTPHDARRLGGMTAQSVRT